MSKHRKTCKSPMPVKLNRAIAIGAVAGSAVGFGALLTANSPMAYADTDSSWWLLSGNNTPIASGNNLVIGTSGNGNSNQLALGTGNILNAQVNLFSLGVATVANAAPATGGAAVGGAALSAATEAGVPIGGLAVGGAAVNPAVGINPAIGGLGGLGTALG